MTAKPVESRLFGRGAFLETLLWAILASACSAPESSQPTPFAQAPAVRPESWFTDITAEVGLDFQHRSGLDGSFFMPQIVGSGGALFDYDDDGDLDIYLINGGPHDPRGPERALLSNRLYRQESDGRFTDRTEESGLGDTGYGMGTALGDIDNDGDLDLYVTNYGADALYRNDGGGRFTDVTASAGIKAEKWSTSACFFDYDRDGHLDLFIATYVDYNPPKACTDSAGRKEYCGPGVFEGVTDALYRNDGDGSFTEVTGDSGIARIASKGLGVVSADFNMDGWSDLFVANDGEENDLWINSGDGRFENRSVAMGTAVNIFGKPEASMGIAVGDVDGDLQLDLFLTHLERETNTFYTSVGASGFQDSTATSGLGADSLHYTGFGTGFFDADHDGDLDLFLVNGRVTRGPAMATVDALNRLRPDEDILQEFRDGYAEPNLLYENLGNGRFRNVCESGGSICSVAEVSRGLMFGDIDGDGDNDVLITNANGPARLFRNDVPDKGHWLRVRAMNPELNRDSIGAVVIATAAGRELLRLVTHAYSYLAATEAVSHFGLGPADRVDKIAVRWSDGSMEVFPGAVADQRITLLKGEGAPQP